MGPTSVAWELSDFETFSFNLSSLIYHLDMKSAVLLCIFYVCICTFLFTADCFFVFVFIVSGGGQEEQHANTSANYDVELLHHRDAHLEFFKSGVYRQITSQMTTRRLWIPACRFFIHVMNIRSSLCCAGDLHMAGTSTRENGLKETITLKWCTPRTNSIGGQKGVSGGFCQTWNTVQG